MKIWLVSGLFAIGLAACSSKVALPDEGLFASIKTNKGDILVRLEFEKAPLTVMNFVGLAEGLFDVPDAPQTSRGKPYFDSLSFHRVETGFVIQGGDPEGDGTGGPGYEFANEIVSGLNHDSAGILSMANAGPNTNGSQFFITLAPAPFLDGSYNVFGKVVEGMDAVERIEVGDKMSEVRIYRQGSPAKAFAVSWEAFRELSEELLRTQRQDALSNEQKSRRVLLNFARQQWPDIRWEENNVENSVQYAILQRGSGPTGAELADVGSYRLHYSLWVPNPDIVQVDSSRERGEPIELAPGQVIAAWGETMPQMQVGERRVILVPSSLGYGERGTPPAIAPNSPLLFEMELLGFVR